MPDDPRVVTTWIAAGGALAVAVVGMVASILSAIVSARNSRELERFRREAEQSRKDKEIIDGRLKEGLDALSRALSAIQHMKDRMLLVLHANDSSIGAESAIHMFILKL